MVSTPGTQRPPSTDSLGYLKLHLHGSEGREAPCSAVVNAANAATRDGGLEEKDVKSKSTDNHVGAEIFPAENRRLVDVTRDKPVKVTVRVVVPTRDHPKFNFVGKLLGPQGNSLKRLQEETMTKMAILGRGSMRDRQKEEELRISGDPKFSHLQLELHVEVSAVAPPAEAHARIALALAEVRRFLVPDFNDDIRQEQMWELHMLKSSREHVADALLPAGISKSVGVPAPADDEAIIGDIHLEEAAPQVAIAVPHLARPLAAETSLRLFSSRGLAAGLVGNGTVHTNGRKRPYIAMSPMKRTVLSILARARAAQGKDVSNVCTIGQGIGAH